MPASLYADGKHTVVDVAALFGVSRQTIYRAALESEAVAS
jgi:DeoR/GlpR family transcriptional regulator of sugar metabolism